MTKINGKNFDFETVDNCFNELMKIEGIDEFTITKEACEKIKNILGITVDKGEMEIRAIRNAVVYLFGKIINKILHIKDDGNMDENYNPTAKQAKEDFNNYQKCNMYMSAITGTIDEELYNRGFMI